MFRNIRFSSGRTVGGDRELPFVRFEIHSSSFPQDQSHYLISLSLTVKAGSLILVFHKRIKLGVYMEAQGHSVVQDL